MQTDLYCHVDNSPRAFSRYASAMAETRHLFFSPITELTVILRLILAFTSRSGNKNADANRSASRSDDRFPFGSPCLCIIKWPSSWAASKILLSAVLKLFKNMNGL